MHRPSDKEIPFLSAGLDHKELARILQRIDEQLELRPLYRAQLVDHGEPMTQTGEPPPLPNFTDLRNQIHIMRQSRAPLFVVEGSLSRRIVRRLLNLPIKVFGRKQIQFHRDLFQIIDLLLQALVNLRQHAIHQSHTDRLIQQQQAYIQLLQEAVSVLQARADLQQREIRSLQKQIAGAEHVQTDDC